MMKGLRQAMKRLDDDFYSELRLSIRAMDWMFHRLSVGHQWARTTDYLFVRGFLYDVIEYMDANEGLKEYSDLATILKHDMKTVNMIAKAKAYARTIYQLNKTDVSGELETRFSRVMWTLNTFYDWMKDVIKQPKKTTC